MPKCVAAAPRKVTPDVPYWASSPAPGERQGVEPVDQLHFALRRWAVAAPHAVDGHGLLLRLLSTLILASVPSAQTRAALLSLRRRELEQLR